MIISLQGKLAFIIRIRAVENTGVFANNFALHITAQILPSFIASNHVELSRTLSYDNRTMVTCSNGWVTGQSFAQRTRQGNSGVDGSVILCLSQTFGIGKSDFPPFAICVTLLDSDVNRSHDFERLINRCFITRSNSFLGFLFLWRLEIMIYKVIIMLCVWSKLLSWISMRIGA